MSKSYIRIEITPHSKTLLPCVALTRKSRESTESQFFALLGYSETKLSKLTPIEQETARDTLEFALRLIGGFEYIPESPDRIDAFFENKLLDFETKILQTFPKSGHLHAVLGITQGAKVLFATSGDILALQITPNSITNLAQSSDNSVLNFDTFQSGMLNTHSYLLFTPKQTNIILKASELKNLVISRSPERKLDYLEHIWQNRAAQEPFRAVLLEAKPKISKPTQTTAVSIANLLSTETKTEELLAPPVFKPLVKGIHTAIQKTYRGMRNIIETYKVKKNSIRLAEQKKLTATPQTRTQPRTEAQLSMRPQRQYQSQRQIFQMFSVFLSRFQSRGRIPNLSRCLSNFSAKIKQSFTAKQADIYATVSLCAKQLIKKTRRSLNFLRAEKIIAYFNQFSLRSKILLLLAFTSLFIFTESVLLTLQHSRVATADQALKTEIAAIYTIADDANASFIYGDEEKTRSQMEQAKIRVAQLPEFQNQVIKQFQIRSRRALNNAITQTTLNELNEYLQPIQQRLQHLVKIETPSPVAEKIIATLNLKNQPHTTAIYNKKLYELRPSENQIFKHESTLKGLGSGSPWVQDNTDVRKAVSLTVDGSIYVIENTGKVTEFRKEYKTNFTIKNIDPPIIKAAKIWTSENSGYLYILDANANRLAVFSKKTGLLKTQYTSLTFADLKDFAIDEKTKTAYLLDGIKVVSIPLSHF